MRFLLTKIKHTLELVKFSHSIFALPFALASLFFAANGFPPLKILGLIILAMVFARNTAMAFNRLVDIQIDAKNPRTASRHLPKGLISKRFAVVFIIINILLFVGTTYFFNQLAFVLSPIALAIICLYSLTKRWTHWTQLFLGFALGVSPVGAWIALRGTLDLFPILLGLAVMFWVAGFDIIYATQDYSFDKKEGLKSLVVKLGLPKSLSIAKLFHVICVAILIGLGSWYGFKIYYFLTILIISLFFIYEHHLVKPTNLSRVNAAFFNINGIIGIIFLVGTMIEVVLS